MIQSIERNMHKRRGKAVSVDEVRKHASTKNCCLGTGIPRGAPKDKGHVCKCATRRFLSKYPGIVMDAEGHAWWPEDGTAEEASTVEQVGGVLAGADVPDRPETKRAAGRREHAEKLRTRLDTLKTDELLAQENVAVARAEKVAEADGLRGQYEDATASAASYAKSITTIDGQIADAEALLQELRKSRDTAEARAKEESDRAAALSAQVDAVMAQADEVSAAERSRLHRLSRDREALERRIHRIESRL